MDIAMSDSGYFNNIPTLPHDELDNALPATPMKNSKVSTCPTGSTNLSLSIKKPQLTKERDSNTETDQTDGTSEAHDDAMNIFPRTFVNISMNDLNFCECCGQGSFGTVYRAHWVMQNNKEVAVKKLNRMDKEVHILSILSHRNIIQFFGACTDVPNFCLVTEYAPYGSLYSFLATPQSENLEFVVEVHLPVLTTEIFMATTKTYYDEFVQLLSWARDMSLGMNYLHEEAPLRVIHRDLKSKNLLICQDFSLKICDFGASRFFDETAIMTITGTYPWMAPELIQGLPTSETCDVYSYGVVLWELLTREVPFKELQGFQIAWIVVEKQERPVIPSSCPQKFADLMRNCWLAEAAKRPPFSEIIVELNTMIDDTELANETTSFVQSKEDWIKEVRSKIEDIQQYEKDLQAKESELKEREKILKKWEKSLIKELQGTFPLGVAHYSKVSERLSCKISGTGEGAVDSVKNVLDHIMSKSGLQNDTLQGPTTSPVFFNSGNKTGSPMFGNLSSNSSPTPFFTSPLSTRQNSLSSSTSVTSDSQQPGTSGGGNWRKPPSPDTKPRQPLLQSDIRYDKKKVNMGSEHFPNDLSSISPEFSKILTGEKFNGQPPKGTRKLQKQISTSSEEYQFEGSKMSRCTTTKDDSVPGNSGEVKKVDTWEKASGEAKVNRKNETMELDPDVADVSNILVGPPQQNLVVPEVGVIEEALKRMNGSGLENASETALRLSQYIKDIIEEKKKDPSIHPLKTKKTKVGDSFKANKDKDMRSRLHNSLNSKVLKLTRPTGGNEAPSTPKQVPTSDELVSVSQEEKFPIKGDQFPLHKNPSSPGMTHGPQPGSECDTNLKKELTKANLNNIVKQHRLVSPDESKINSDNMKKEVKDSMTQTERNTEETDAQTQTTYVPERRCNMSKESPSTANQHSQIVSKRSLKAEACEQTTENASPRRSREESDDTLFTKPRRQREILRHYYAKYYNDITALQKLSNEEESANTRHSSSDGIAREAHVKPPLRRIHSEGGYDLNRVKEECTEEEGRKNITDHGNTVEKIDPTFYKAENCNDSIERSHSSKAGIGTNRSNVKVEVEFHPRSNSPMEISHDKAKVRDMVKLVHLVRAGADARLNEDVSRQRKVSQAKIVTSDSKHSCYERRPSLTNYHEMRITDLSAQQGYVSQSSSGRSPSVARRPAGTGITTSPQDDPHSNSHPSPSSFSQIPLNFYHQSTAIRIGGPGSNIYETDDYTYFIRPNQSRKK